MRAKTLTKISTAAHSYHRQQCPGLSSLVKGPGLVMDFELSVTLQAEGEKQQTQKVLVFLSLFESLTEASK